MEIDTKYKASDEGGSYVFKEHIIILFNPWNESMFDKCTSLSFAECIKILNSILQLPMLIDNLFNLLTTYYDLIT